MTKHRSGVDFSQSVIALLPQSATDPVSPIAGQIYYNTSLNVTFFYNGTVWVSMAAFSGAVTIQGTITNADTNPDYPAGLSGDAYFITTNAGKIGGASGKVVEIGDLLICQTTNAGGDEASVGMDWFVVQNNVVNASETTSGIIKISTQLQVTTGTDDNSAITPLKYVTDRNSNKCTTPTIVGDNSTFTFTVNHTAGIDNICQVRDLSNNKLVLVDVTFGSLSNVITFVTAPLTTESYKVIIK